MPDVVLLDPFMPRALLSVASLVAGTALLMWMGELISQRGIGNGMSMLIFASVVESLPRGYWAILEEEKWIVFAVLSLAAFQANFQIADLIVMLVFGALGFFMKTYGWPRPPIIISVV